MEDRSFDALTRSLALGSNRRQILKRLLGLGGAALAGTAIHDAEAALRPTPTPRPPSCPGVQIPCGNDCCCPPGTDKCGPDCCPDAQAQCCDNACCYGTCYGEELCCPTGRAYCAITGECCPDGWTCCPAAGCLSPGQCCTAADCIPAPCTRVECTAEHDCTESGVDCTNGGVEACCQEGQVCLGDGSCCTPVCDGCDGGDDGCGGTCTCPAGQVCMEDGTCCTPTCPGLTCGNDDGCGGVCGCPEGYGCGDDGQCHVCTTCNPHFEECPGAVSCYTYCTPDGVVCLSGIWGNVCTSHDECAAGEYCMLTCGGLRRCLPRCGPGA
jgi:hypothetical protein